MSDDSEDMRIVSAEQSQIRLSARGKWFHAGEPFSNQKIIDFFHRAISKDPQGRYCLHNAIEGKRERVYFQLEDTAYFVWRLWLGPGGQHLVGLLNTGDQVEIDIHTMADDERGVMYCQVLDGDRAQVSPAALAQLSEMAEMDEHGVHVTIAGERVTVSKP